MKKFITALSILYCLIIPVLISCGHGSPDIKKPVAVKGVLDLRGWNFTKDGSVALDGEWEFCWNHLLGSSDFAKTANQKDCGFITVPSLWNNHKVDGIDLTGKGYATYHLKIINSSDKKLKTLIINRVYSAYKLWINGVLEDKIGTADKQLKAREDYVFIHNKRLSSFTPVEGENEIILQVFNTEYKSGGIDRPLQLEDGDAAAQKELNRYTANMIVVGLLLFVAIYNIVFYFFRRKETAPLYLGFFSLGWAINTYNVQSPILSGSLSYFGNPFLVDYVTVILLVPLCLMTIKSMYPDELSTIIVRISQFLTVGFLIPLFFVGVRASEQIMKVFFILCIVFILYSAYVFIKTLKNRRDDSVLFCIGFAIVFIGIINDILFILRIIDTTNVAQYGMVALSFTITIVISRRLSRALRTVEELSKDLAEKNISLQKLDRLKDQFLANTSHELRTPLHGMIGLSESLIEGAAGGLPPKAVENLTLISSSGHQLANMVNDLLDMAKIQDEGLSLNLRPVDLHSLSEMVVELSLPMIGGKPLEIINNIGAEIPLAYADEERIRQVLYNLIGNAIKFTNKGTIETSASIIDPADDESGAAADKMIEIRVSDTGIGVPDEYRDIIFDAYRQVDGSNTRSYPGTGLGLAIAKQIIELHKGTIRVMSVKNKGSVFAFTLPVSSDQVADHHENIIIESMYDSPLSTEEAEGRFRVPAAMSDIGFDKDPVFLVVDDDPVNVMILRNYLESKHCVVKTASNGVNALEIIEEDGPIDLVLLDIMMPGMSGYEVCRRVRMNHQPEELPVIMLTAKNMMSDIDAAFEAGANDYIVKPFSISELFARVSTMLKLRNVRKSAAEGITIRARNRVYSLIFKEIIYITSHSKNIVIHTGEREIVLPFLMKEIIDRLPPDMFVRIHKSHIINIHYVHSMYHVLSGRYRVRLNDNDDTELPVGAAFLESLRKKI